jgi:hypothetical protein
VSWGKKLPKGLLKNPASGVPYGKKKVEIFRKIDSMLERKKIRNRYI